MKQADVIQLVQDQLLPGLRQERTRLDVFDKWARWAPPDEPLPAGATKEFKQLLELSKTPWLRLIVDTFVQILFVDGYRSPQDRDNAGPWRTWRANSMDRRQAAIYRAAMNYGYSFVTVLPGKDPLTGEARSVMRGCSPRKMFAVYADLEADDWPMYALRAEWQKRTNTWSLEFLDEDTQVFLTAEQDGANMRWLETRTHGAGVPPVVRYCNQLDLDGRADGEVEPYIGVVRRIHKGLHDRLLLQHHASWKVRTIAGMTQPDDAEKANAEKLRLMVDSILVADDPDTKFGTLDETPVDGLIKADERDIQTLAAVAQVPGHILTGEMINLSAEALAAARAATTQKGAEKQTSFGESHGQALRLAALLEGDTTAAGDVMSRCTWQDMEIRSLGQASDALGKLAQMLGVPVQALWSRIPGITQTDVAEWKTLALSDDPLTELLRTQLAPSPPGTPGGAGAAGGAGGAPAG